MNLLIRADATSKIGTGHVMRSLALAQKWRNRGGSAFFACRCESDSLKNRISDEGFELIEIKQPHPDPSDLETVLSFLRKTRIGDETASDWLALDGYHFDPDYQKALRNAGLRVLVIDDYNHQPLYHADILLNQNIKAENLSYFCDQDTVLLLGTKYALIRNEFLGKERELREFPAVALKVLLTLGGSDPDNIVLKVFQALKLLDIKGLEVNIIVGPANPHLKQIEKEIHGLNFLPQSFHIIQNGDMPGLMACADAAVSGGGGTCLELAFMGVPFLVITLAENQQATGPHLQDVGAAIDLGWGDELNIRDLSDTLESLLKNSSQRRKMSAKATGLVDGQGSNRVASVMTWLSEGMGDSALTLREASPDDCRQIWLLANDRSVRENSFNRGYIVFEDHTRWYQNKLESHGTAFYVLDLCGAIGGQIRYERQGDAAEINYSIAPAFRGKGLGRRLIENTVAMACSKLNVDRVFAIVKKSNKASTRTFLNAGFKKVSNEKVHNLDCSLYEKGFSRY